MNPRDIFCPNIECPARGQTNKGNIHGYMQKKHRYQRDVCQQTFTTTKGTIFYRLRTNPATVIIVITLLAYGCPIQAIVQAFGFNERTVRGWWQRDYKVPLPRWEPPVRRGRPFRMTRQLIEKWCK